MRITSIENRLKQRVHTPAFYQTHFNYNTFKRQEPLPTHPTHIPFLTIVIIKLKHFSFQYTCINKLKFHSFFEHRGKTSPTAPFNLALHANVLMVHDKYPLPHSPVKSRCPVVQNVDLVLFNLPQKGPN